MSSDTVRILHTSDVHIGAFTERWSPHPRKCLHAFQIVVDRALEEQVDLILIAGDFFDHNRIRPDVAEVVMGQLERLPMPTVILPGNHDPLDQNSVYWRMDLEGRTPNVYLIKNPEGETVSYPELGVAVWGKPHVSYDDVDLYPLKELPPRGPEPWQIAIGHGHYVREPADAGRSYPIYPEEIANCGRDYVALGHWDAHMNISHGNVVAYYPGSPTWVGLSSIVELSNPTGSRDISVTSFAVSP